LSDTSTSTTGAPLALVAPGGHGRARAVFGFTAALSVSLLLASLMIGGVRVAPSEVLDALAAVVSGGAADVGREQLIINHIRLPRAIATFSVGAVLALSGAMLQGLFRNPLADPGLIGVSAGAALAAVATIVLSSLAAAALPESVIRFVVPVGAFAGGFLTTMLIYRIALAEGRVRVATMLLAGIAVNAIAGAGIGAFVYMSDDQQLRDLTFWQMGSLGSVTWTLLLPCLPFFVAPVLLMRRIATPLNILSLGEGEAEALGVEVDRLVRTVIVLVALGVGAAVAVSGIIGFVGLVVPHLVRIAAGPDHRTLLPVSALAGGSLLLVADAVARTVVIPAELPIGLVTSAVGGPFFLWLLLGYKARARE